MANETKFAFQGHACINGTLPHFFTFAWNSNFCNKTQAAICCIVEIQLARYQERKVFLDYLSLSPTPTCPLK